MNASTVTLVNDLGTEFCRFSWAMLWQSSILVAVLFVIDLLLRKHVRAIVRHALWLLVLLKLVLPPTFSLPTGIGYWVGYLLPTRLQMEDPIANVLKEHPSNTKDLAYNTKLTKPARALAEVSVDVNEELFAQLKHPFLTDIDDAIAIPASQQKSSMEPENIHAETVEIQSRSSNSQKPQIAWQAILFLCWIAGVMVLVGLLAQRILSVRRLVAKSKPADPGLISLLMDCQAHLGFRKVIELRVSDTPLTPAVAGLLHPVILLPHPLATGLSMLQLRAVLCHELVHVKRRDLHVNLVQTILQIFYFYNPLLWFANDMLRQVREQAVDETVLSRFSDHVKDYCDTLVDIAILSRLKPYLSLRLVGVVESKKTLAVRLKHICNRPLPTRARLGPIALSMVFLIGCVALPMAKGQTFLFNMMPNTKRASEYIQANQIGEAIKEFSKIIEMEPRAYWAYLNRGFCYYRLKKYELAIADYSKAIELGSELYRAYCSREDTYGNVYYRFKTYKPAKADYSKVMELSSELYRAYCSRGDAYAESTQLTKAQSDYSNAIEFYPDMAEAYCKNADIWLTKGKNEAAIMGYTRAIKIDPEYAEAYKGRAIAYYNIGEYEKAWEDIGKAKKNGPVDRALWLKLR